MKTMQLTLEVPNTLGYRLKSIPNLNEFIVKVLSQSLSFPKSIPKSFDKNGKIVGIAIQEITGADGIGYLVPVEVIQHFFDDIEDGQMDEKFLE